MQILPTSSRLACPILAWAVLAWFVLTLGAASAAPVVQPAVMALVCSEGATKVVLVDQDGAVSHGKGHTLDCPLCLPGGVPPALAPPPAPLAQPRSAAVDLVQDFHLVTHAGAPLPARGPPA